MAQSADALANIARSLRQTIDETAAREAAWTHPGQPAHPAQPAQVTQPAEHTSSAARYVERLRELAAQRQSLVPAAQAIARRAAVTDDELAACEAELRDLAARTEALRQKLAQWVAVAIR